MAGGGGRQAAEQSKAAQRSAAQGTGVGGVRGNEVERGEQAARVQKEFRLA
jgi:hypothetical protein